MDRGEALMFKNQYKEAYNAICPSQELVSEMVKRAKAEKNGDGKKLKRTDLCQKRH